MKRPYLLVLALLTAGCSNQEQATPKPLTTADLAIDIKAGRLERLSRALLADPMGEIEDDGETNLLTVAVRAKNDRAIDILLLHGASPDGSIYSWDTPLTCAVKNCDVKLVEKLLAFGASPDKATPLDSISNSAEGKQIATMLVDRRADLNRYTRWNGSLLNSAIGKGEWCVKLLLELGADPNGPKDSHSSPLDIATEQNKPTIAKLLARFGGTYKARLGASKSVRPNETATSVLKAWAVQHGK